MTNVGIHAAFRSGRGRVRKNNEDAFFFNGRFAPLKEMDREARGAEDFDTRQSLFAICDGIGGYENGEVAAYTAVSRLPALGAALLQEHFGSAVTRWAAETNRTITEKARDGGCTLALLFFSNRRVYTAHIGDSRVYQLRGGKLTRLTKDHTKIQVLLDAGVISAEEAETYPHRHVITRALGMRTEEDEKCAPVTQGPLTIQNRDRYMICSDGVTDMISDGRIAAILARERTADDCAEAIYQAALAAGGRDNTSVIVIEVESDSEITLANEEKQKRPSLEATWPSGKSTAEKTVRIEHVTTIRHCSGLEITVRSLVSSAPRRTVPQNRPIGGDA